MQVNVLDTEKQLLGWLEKVHAAEEVVLPKYSEPILLV
jgi:antitoxin (DNA-binding transcriptional repressor) of toxin-antitoxin stability system